MENDVAKSPLVEHTRTLATLISERFQSLEPMTGNLRVSKLSDIIINEMNQFGLEVLAVHAKEVKEKMDPKLREMRLECLKLAKEMCKTDEEIIPLAESYLKYVMDGAGEAKKDDERVYNDPNKKLQIFPGKS